MRLALICALLIATPSLARPSDMDDKKPVDPNKVVCRTQDRPYAVSSKPGKR